MDGLIIPFSKLHSAILFTSPKDNKLERGISNQVGYPRNKLYRDLLQYRLPRDQEVPGQVKSELFTKSHLPGLRTEGNTCRNRVKEIRGNDRISGCDQHVPINKTRDDKESGDILCKKTHQRDQEDNQPLFGPHPFRYELHTHLL